MKEQNKSLLELAEDMVGLIQEQKKLNDENEAYLIKGSTFWGKSFHTGENYK